MTQTTANLAEDFKVGCRVQLHPATDMWMRGARYGNVTKIGRKYITVQLDVWKTPIRIHPDNLIFVHN